MRINLLQPVAVAEQCYLSEALWWVALQRFPVEFITENGTDQRIDLKYIDGIEPNLPGDSLVTDEECARVGLPPNPMFDAAERGEFHSEPDHLRWLMQLELSEADRQELEQRLEVSEAFHAQQHRWDKVLKEFLDLHQARLFVALREGRLQARGRRLGWPTMAECIKALEASEWKDWDEITWEPIPGDAWISDRIDWEGSSCEGRDSTFCLILIDTEALLSCFPTPLPEPFDGVVKISDYLALLEPSATVGTSVTRQRRGRPSFDWEALHVEIAKRIAHSTLPGKQEAMIAEMQQWCLANWGREVGRSTLLQKLKPYYDAFVRTSENRP